MRRHLCPHTLPLNSAPAARSRRGFFVGVMRLAKLSHSCTDPTIADGLKSQASATERPY